jgi:predicted deacylase
MIPEDIWCLTNKDKKQSPVVVILGGVHGDELSGIEVIKKLKDFFGLSDKGFGEYEIEGIDGKIYLGFGNPKAIEKNTRAAGEGLDLNRSFNPEKIKLEEKPSDQADLIRARQLAPILEEADYLVDIHCTSSPSAPFVIVTKAEIDRIKSISKFTSAKYLLLDPKGIYPSYLGLETNYSTDDYVNNFCSKNGVGICYETGYEKDITVVDKVFLEVLSIMRHANAIDNTFLESKNLKLDYFQNDQDVYFIDDIAIAKSDGFNYEKGMDIGWQEVEEGQLVGNYNNGEKEFAKKTGMYLFPTGASKVKKGIALYYIAKPAD